VFESSGFRGVTVPFGFEIHWFQPGSIVIETGIQWIPVPSFETGKTNPVGLNPVKKDSEVEADHPAIKMENSLLTTRDS
jgi:hypothetical protein